MSKSFIYKSKYLKRNMKITHREERILSIQFQLPKVSIGEALDKYENFIASALDKYFTHLNANSFNKLQMHLIGTKLQCDVWKELLNVRLGTTISYSELAKRAGYPRAIRAVATAVGKNPIPLIIPCHRIIRSSGEIGKYSGGDNFKIKLLHLEGSL